MQKQPPQPSAEQKGSYGDSRPRLSAERSSAAASTTFRRKGIFESLLPKPTILRPNADQTAAHWIFQDVSHYCIQILRGSQHMIERFGLPHPSSSPQSLIDLVCRSSFDSIHDFRQ